MMRKSITVGWMLAAGFTAMIATVKAQGPLYDKVTVDLPYRVTLNETTLEPGHYVIRQLDSPGGGSRVLQIFTNNGMRLKTSALTIPTLDNNTPSSTKVILHHYGSDYYFDKVWIQGKDYGYEFPLPSAVKSREREKMSAYTVAATYEQTPASANQAGETAVADNTTTISAAPVVSSAPASAPAPVVDNTVVAQNTAPVQAPISTPTEMPHTAGNWLGLLLEGGLLTGAGVVLRRFRA